MYDRKDIHSAISQIALSAVNASAPAGIYFGEVISTSPLEIQIDQKITLSGVNLILSSLVVDRQETITVGGELRNYTVHGELEVGKKL